MKEERNYGIDLLRLLSMLMIVVLHLLGHGGVLRGATLGSLQYKIVWLIEIMAFGAVNIFALISGYVGYNKNDGFVKRFIKLYLEVLFYSVGLFLLVSILSNQHISLIELIKYCLPIIFNKYWYFTAYFGLYLLMPVLNKGIENADSKYLRTIVIFIILLFSVINIFTNSFNLNGGYSVIWLVLLYIIGGSIKKTNALKKIGILPSLIIVAFLVGITYYIKIYGKDITILTLTFKHDNVLNYTFPTILIMAIMLINIFSKIHFSNVLKKIITFLASSSFAVYLINDHPLVRETYLKNKFLFLLDWRILKIVIFIIVFAIAFVIIAILIDKIRRAIFKICCIDKGLNKFIKN
jgi:surface polysaccharide O-acyltransferase-like enzyme